MYVQFTSCFYGVSWTLHKSPALCDKYDLDSILGKGDQLFKFIGTFRYLAIEDLSQGNFVIEKCSIEVKFLANKTREITAGSNLLSITEIKNSDRQIRTGSHRLQDYFRLNLGK